MPKTRTEVLADKEWNKVAVLIDSRPDEHPIYNRASLIYVHSKFGKGTVGAEVGVWDGCLTGAILDFMKPSKLYLVDPWKLYDDYIGELKSCNFSQDYFEQKKFDLLYNIVCDKFKNNNVVNIIRKMSTDGAKDIEDNSLDWVYIDGSHLEEYIVQDLYCWYPKVKIGGIICGHDYLFPGVEAGLTKYEKENNNITVWPYGSDWWINKNG